MRRRRAPARPAARSRFFGGLAGMLSSALVLSGIAVFAAMLAGTGLTRADDAPAIPAYRGYVNDDAGVLREDTRAKLEAFLDQVEKKTGAEFAVLTVRTTAPLDPADYKVKVFETWKIGKKGADNGLLLLVAMEERKIWFETGYGLEGVLPDGLESRIIRERMTPAMRASDVDGAVTAGVLAAAAKIAADKGVTLEWNGQELRYGSDAGESGGHFPVWLIALLVFMVINIIVRSAFGRRGGWYIGPGWGGGFGGGFGGFGGGGGGGGSFGGFGGGSSGGGGGGGGW
jgi:uncharacterized protein